MDARNKGIRRTLIILLAVVLLLFGFVFVRQALLVEPVPATAPDLAPYNTFVYPQSRPLPDFALTDAQGQPFSKAQLKGHWTLVMLGYTYCPDVCPATLSQLQQMLAQLPADLPKPQILFVSVDPTRDTPERLKDYLQFFNPDFRAVTGDPQALAAFARSLNGVFLSQTDAQGQIQIDHSAHLSLLSPAGDLLAIIQPPFNPAHLLASYTAITTWANLGGH